MAMLVVRCYCLPGNPDTLGQHVVGHRPVAESDYVVAQAGLQQDARSHPYTLLRSYCRNNNQLWFYPVSNASRDHNGATPKPIPFDNTGVGKAFSATSVHNGVRKSCAEGLNMLVLHEILAFRIVRAMHCVVHVNAFTHWVDSTSTKDSYTRGPHSQDNL